MVETEKECKCTTWVREPELTGGILTRHHPNCPLFEGKKRFVKIKLHGGSQYIQPLSQLRSALDGEMDGAAPGTKWTLELLEMYQEEYDALPEFTGH